MTALVYQVISKITIKIAINVIPFTAKPVLNLKTTVHNVLIPKPETLNSTAPAKKDISMIYLIFNKNVHNVICFVKPAKTPNKTVFNALLTLKE